jgi:hypothetical protein
VRVECMCVRRCARQELALSPAMISKFSLAVEANEIDGEVLGTFESLQELCENTGLECVVDVAR